MEWKPCGNVLAVKRVYEILLCQRLRTFCSIILIIFCIACDSRLSRVYILFNGYIRT